MSKQSIREKSRAARAARLRTQRILLVALGLFILAVIGYFAFQGLNRPESAAVSTDLVIEDQVVGEGPAAKAGDTITVHYTGYLTDGTQFASSQGGDPYTLTLGVGGVIQGWDEGLIGMQVGGKRKLTIPPDMAYGESGAGGGIIPPNATLIFEVELLEIR